MYAIAFRHTCEDVGKKIKRTKKKYQWDFGFEIKEDDIERHTVILYYSVLSGKRQLVLDGQKISTSSGQFGKYEMKFNLDQRRNMAKVEAHADKSKLFINNVEFKDLFTQRSQQGQSNKIQDNILDEFDSDGDDVSNTEDIQNRQNLEKERYNNVVSKIKGPNPQLFDGPIYKKEENKQPPTSQFNGRFSSFGLNEITSDTQQKSNQQKQQSENKQQTRNSSKQEKAEENPFHGFNFSSWVQNEQPQKSESQLQNNKPFIQDNIHRSQSLSTQQHNQVTQPIKKEECPFFGRSSSQFQQISKQHSAEQSQSHHSKVFDDFFKTNSNTVEDNRQTFQFNNINSFNENLNRNNSSVNDPNFIQMSIQYNNNQTNYYNNKNGSFYQQTQSPQFTLQQQNNYQFDKFNVQQVQNNQINPSPIDLL